MKGGGSVFEIKYVSVPEPGIVITDKSANINYFFVNAIQEFAMHIYYLATNKDVNKDEKFIRENLTSFEVDEKLLENIKVTLQKNCSKTI
jgi:hypothetical protein